MASTFLLLKWRTWRWAPPAISATASVLVADTAKVDGPETGASVLTFPDGESESGLLATLRRKFARCQPAGFLGTDWSNPSYSHPAIMDASDDSLNLGSRRRAP